MGAAALIAADQHRAAAGRAGDVDDGTVGQHDGVAQHVDGAARSSPASSPLASMVPATVDRALVAAQQHHLAAAGLDPCAPSPRRSG
jgi:hypothetical protein